MNILNTINVKKYKTFEEINEFCLNNSEYCINNKEKVCKQMLKIASLDLIFNNNYCENYNQYLIQEFSAKKTETEIVDFLLLHPEFKNSNKMLICKQLLLVNKYKIHPSFDYCKIYTELLILSKKMGKRQSTFNISGNIVIKMSYSLLELCRKLASANLRNFLIYNEYNIDPTSNLVSDITNDSDTDTDIDTDTIKL